MTEVERLELKLLVGPKALTAFEDLSDDERFDLNAAFSLYSGNLYRLGAAMLRVLCAQASEDALSEVSGKERIKIGPLEIEEAASTGGVNTVRAGNWCAEARRLDKLAGGGAGDFPPMIGDWGVVR